MNHVSVYIIFTPWQLATIPISDVISSTLEDASFDVGVRLVLAVAVVGVLVDVVAVTSGVAVVFDGRVWNRWMSINVITNRPHAQVHTGRTGSLEMDAHMGRTIKIKKNAIGPMMRTDDGFDFILINYGVAIFIITCVRMIRSKKETKRIHQK